MPVLANTCRPLECRDNLKILRTRIMRKSLAIESFERLGTARMTYVGRMATRSMLFMKLKKKARFL